MELPFNYIDAVYRKDNKGNISVWYATCFGDKITIYHGILGKTITTTTTRTNRVPLMEVASRYKEKRKTGYKYLNEIRDDKELPRKEGLIDWLRTYLPEERTTIDGTLLPMLAKVYDNENNKLFKSVSYYIGQWKINGLRCFIRAYKDSGLFNNYHLTFQSREGIYWKSLGYLENNLLAVLPTTLLDLMVEEGWTLDGEVYIPGFTVNDINHAVKDPRCPENKLVQFWCYDIACEDYTQEERINNLYKYLGQFITDFGSLQPHLSHKCVIEVLPTFEIDNGGKAIELRNSFIDKGFEGLILRNPSTEYQFGKRNSSMIKYKKTTDGIFEILDIYPEGNKRQDIPLFKCKNDINDETFECHINGTFDYQQIILEYRDRYIGRKLYISYGERSGISQVPFHIKEVRFVD